MNPLTLETSIHQFDWGNEKRDVIQIAPLETIEALTDPKGPSGAELRQLAHGSTAQVMEVFLDMGDIRNRLGKRPVVLGIPRGGYPPATGAYESVQASQPRAELVFSNAGEGRDRDLGHLPNKLPKDTTSIIIADGVVGAGGESIAHLDAIFEQIPQSQIEVIGFLSIAAATHGLENITDHMAEVYPGIPYQFGTMKLYDKEGKNKYIGWREVDSRRVFFVGVGDYGKRVQGDELTTQELYELYKTQTPARRA